jgi:hypothetical protein
LVPGEGRPKGGKKKGQARQNGSSGQSPNQGTPKPAPRRYWENPSLGGSRQFLFDTADKLRIGHLRPISLAQETFQVAFADVGEIG